MDTRIHADGKCALPPFPVNGVRLSKKPARFGIELIDLAEGRSEVICEYEDLHNPHPQFDRHKGRQVLVQHNRGAEYDDEGLPVKRRGKAGVGLFLGVSTLCRLGFFASLVECLFHKQIVECDGNGFGDVAEFCHVDFGGVTDDGDEFGAALDVVFVKV